MALCSNKRGIRAFVGAFVISDTIARNDPGDVSQAGNQGQYVRIHSMQS
jgi:hypothetical protein